MVVSVYKIYYVSSLLIASLLVLIISSFIFIPQYTRAVRVEKNGILIKAEIVDMKSRHDWFAHNGRPRYVDDVFIEYDVDGEKYEGKLYWKYPLIAVGRNIDILINKDNPSEFADPYSISKGGFLVIPAVAFLLTLIGIISTVWQWHRKPPLWYTKERDIGYRD